MDKAMLKEILGDSAVVSDPQNYRLWLESVIVGGDRKRRARCVITLISYWLEANDNTYCPAETQDIDATISTLIDHVSKCVDADQVKKYRYDYTTLGVLILNADHYVGGLTMANTIHLLDILREEYNGRRCPKCRAKITKSARLCDHCGTATIIL